MEVVSAKEGWESGNPFTVKCEQGYSAEPEQGNLTCMDEQWVNPSSCLGEFLKGL